MKFKLEIECDGSAFSETENGLGVEVARILRLVANRAEHINPTDRWIFVEAVEPDCNGNSCCSFRFVED